jgi:RNA polymerase sigma-70 factor, ECF subfamily
MDRTASARSAPDPRPRAGGADGPGAAAGAGGADTANTADGADGRDPPRDDDPAEAALLAGLRAGDEAAFERLVRQHGGRMLAVARRMLRADQDAQDAVQDALLSASRSIGGFEGGSRLGTWLHRIVVNAALMKLRTQRRRDEPLIDDLLPQFVEDGHAVEPAAPWRDSAEALLQQRETAELVRASIDRLPESHRVVLLLRDIEELSTADAAAVLGITPNAVKIRLHRARQALRTLLDPHFRKSLP